MAGLFGAVEVAQKASSKDIEYLKLKDGNNKFRILTAPVQFYKHWDLPAGSELQAAPCVNRPGYDQGGKVCPLCALNEANSAVAKRKHYFSMGVEQGGSVLVAEFTQQSIINEIKKLEDPAHELWGDVVQGDIRNVELVITREKTGSRAMDVKYTVGVFPKSKTLTAEALDELTAQVPDLGRIKAPIDISTEEGRGKWADILAKVNLDS